MRPFEEDFKALNEALQEMGGAGRPVRSSQRVVAGREERRLRHQVLRDEARIDQLEIQIDDLVTSIIARESPVARDMRFVVVAIKINTDLERMGDMAVGIVERSLGRDAPAGTPARERFRRDRQVCGVDGSAVPGCVR